MMVQNTVNKILEGKDVRNSLMEAEFKSAGQILFDILNYYKGRYGYEIKYPNKNAYLEFWKDGECLGGFTPSKTDLTHNIIELSRIVV